jgi:hypothetical protein
VKHLYSKVPLSIRDDISIDNLDRVEYMNSEGIVEQEVKGGSSQLSIQTHCLDNKGMVI